MPDIINAAACLALCCCCCCPQVPQLYKRLRYPFQISKSNLTAVGSPHTWPSLLAALTWLVELLNYQERAEAARQVHREVVGWGGRGQGGVCGAVLQENHSFRAPPLDPPPTLPPARCRRRTWAWTSAAAPRPSSSSTPRRYCCCCGTGTATDASGMDVRACFIPPPRPPSCAI